MANACGHARTAAIAGAALRAMVGYVAVVAVAAFADAATTAAPAQSYAVATRPDVAYAEHDGVRLTGDLYAPKGVDKAPVIVAVHGGGWQAGSPNSYRYWGAFLARNGYALFAIRYRLSKPGEKSYPQAVYDVKAAVQFVRAKAGELGVDPARIGLMGDSAGGHLAALTALAAAEPRFSAEYRGDPNAAVPADVKAVVSFYGVYDMAQQWEHDQINRPADQITEKFIGMPPARDRFAYFNASPAAYATRDRNQTRFLLIQGKEDDIVDPRQASNFLTLLKQSGFNARLLLVPGAGHFFASDPIEETDSFAAQMAPPVLRFLKASL